uniref:THAP-type domain-containing protein n=1 Tax=Clytia hemisphaerica TaxID=252671 RepID=A0A7M5UG70_9CNID
MASNNNSRPSSKRSRSRTCAVVGCKSSDYRFSKWEDEWCDLHQTTYSNSVCTCLPPFQLFTFPTERENPEARMIWRELINRREPSNKNLLWSPSRHKQSRVCSVHFPDGMPTKTNPHPTIFLNNNVDVDVAIGNKNKTTRRRLSYNNNNDNDDDAVVPNPTDVPNPVVDDSSLAIDFDVSPGPIPSTRDESPNNKPIINNANRQCLFLPSFFVFRHGTYRNMFFSCMVTVASLLCFGWMLKSKYFAALKEINKLKDGLHKKELLTRYRSIECIVLRRENQKLKKNCTCKLPIHEITIKDDKNCLFYTGIENFPFVKLFNFIFPYVKRRWVGFKFTSTILKRKFSKIPARMGPERKLCGKDEFLMLLMKLRLGLLEKDLANRFRVSISTTSRVIRTWLKVSSSIMKSLIFVPDQGVLNITKPPVFKPIKNLHSIIDATELFIETPKGLINQRLTWSQYKHHNTLKVLVAVSANSSVIFMSPAYVGGISDKAITLHTDTQVRF